MQLSGSEQFSHRKRIWHFSRTAPLPAVDQRANIDLFKGTLLAMGENFRRLDVIDEVTHLVDSIFRK